MNAEQAFLNWAHAVTLELNKQKKRNDFAGVGSGSLDELNSAMHDLHDAVREYMEGTGKPDSLDATGELLEALKRIHRTSVAETFHGDVKQFQAWLDSFTEDAITRAGGAL